MIANDELDRGDSRSRLVGKGVGSWIGEGMFEAGFAPGCGWSPNFVQHYLPRWPQTCSSMLFAVLNNSFNSSLLSRFISSCLSISLCKLAVRARASGLSPPCGAAESSPSVLFFLAANSLARPRPERSFLLKVLIIRSLCRSLSAFHASDRCAFYKSASFAPNPILPSVSSLPLYASVMGSDPFLVVAKSNSIIFYYPRDWCPLCWGCWHYSHYSRYFLRCIAFGTTTPSSRVKVSSSLVASPS